MPNKPINATCEDARALWVAFGYKMKRGKTQVTVPGVAPADPSKWSEASQRSVSAEWTREYRDIQYSCWRCKAHAIFSAEDQKRTYEVKKAPIDQRRILCAECWQRSLVIARDIESCKKTWAESKSKLQQDGAFLSQWLQLLKEQEQYVRYRPDTATKNMLGNLLHRIAEQTVAADRREDAPPAER